MKKNELLAKSIQKAKELELEHCVHFHTVAAECLEQLYVQMNAASEKGKTELILHLDGDWNRKLLWSHQDTGNNKCVVYLPKFDEHDVKFLYGILKYDLIQNGYYVSDWYPPYSTYSKNIMEFYISWGDEDFKLELSAYDKIKNFIVKLFRF